MNKSSPLTTRLWKRFHSPFKLMFDIIWEKYFQVRSHCITSRCNPN
ncbi:MAG: hypothetical protein V7K68_05610 [Nostoc sp.]